jgi:2-(3-amino-3-carboxypropyl)histidine synthase
MYDFRLDEVAEWVRKIDARVVALQLPEGLKVYAQEITRRLESMTSASCLIVGDPCYGACDYTVRYHTYADALVQFGHADIPSMGRDDRVLFVEIFLDLNVMPLLEIALLRLKDRIGLITTVQHVRSLPQVRSWLEAHGKKVLIGKGDGRIKFDGQVLGCNISAPQGIADQVDQFLYIGSGDFHPLSVAIGSNRPVVILDPLMKEVRGIEDLRDRILRQRHGAIARAMNADSFVILVSTKVGQARMDLARRLRNMTEEGGKRAEIVLLEEFHPDRLLPYKADAFVSTACPRIAIDDYLRYDRPLLTPVEMEIVLGKRLWSDYRLDEIPG